MFYTPSSRIGQNIMRIELLDTYGILRIKTTEFLFDLEDLPLIKGRDSWYCDKDGYLVSSYFYNGVRRFVRFHRLVMHAESNLQVSIGDYSRTGNQYPDVVLR